MHGFMNQNKMSRPNRDASRPVICKKIRHALLAPGFHPGLIDPMQRQSTVKRLQDRRAARTEKQNFESELSRRGFRHEDFALVLQARST
jgi:hypothetical protein